MKGNAMAAAMGWAQKNAPRVARYRELAGLTS
jgi:hypothetical protein